MSVSNPVDSGGGLVAFDRDLQGLAEQMNTVGGWAALMQDSVNNTNEDDDLDRDEEDRGNTRVEEQPTLDDHGPPYAIQVLNIPDGTDSDSLYLFFGGDEKIDSFELKKAGRANIVYKTAQFMNEHYSKYMKFGQVDLRCFRLPPSSAPASYQESHSRKSSYQQARDSYSHQGSNYGSTTSLASSQYGSHGRRYDHGSSRDYQTMVPPGKYREDRGMRGGGYGRKSFRGDFHGGYDRRSNYTGYGGEIQRSESYSYDKERPAPINRSRTEDGLAERRQSDLMSRASSQFSVDQDDSKPVVKKPSTKDIFGDAKPVDTAQKMKELEERQAEKKKLEKEKIAEKNQIQQQQQQHQQQPQQHMQQYQQQLHQHQQQNMTQQHPHMGYYPPVYQHPPPNYQYRPPEFITPMVGLGPGAAPPQHYMRTPQHYPQDHPSMHFRGPPGSFRIMQRPDTDVNANTNINNVNPPQDPEHPRPNIPQTPTMDHPINTIKEEPSIVIPRRPSASQENNKGNPAGAHSQEKSANPPSKPYVRTFNNSSHKSGSFDGGRGNRGGRGGSRGGRGGYHGPKPDSTVLQGAEVQEKINKEAAQPAPIDNNKKNINKGKDIHGSQASLSSRGAPRGGGANKNRGRGGFKTRGSRDDRNSRDDHSQKSDTPRENKPFPQRKPSKGDGQKSQNPASAPAKPEPKKEEVKQEPVVTPKAEPTPTVDNKEKKKKKKPNTAKNLTPLNNNKFAALANDNGDE